LASERPHRPSADAIIRLAQAFDVSCDYLLVDDAPRRPFRSAEDVLGDRLATIAELGDHDRELVLSFIDALVTKTASKPSPASAEAVHDHTVKLTEHYLCLGA
jgi:hypothetical protein